MRRFALIVLLSVFASFLGLDGPGATALFEKAVPGAPASSALAQGPLPPKGRVLFVDYVAPKSQTFSIDGDGTNLRQITNHPESTSTPAWSPDGEKIAFFAYVDPSDATSFAIFTQSAAGGGATQVTAANDGVAEVSPHWSPRGDKIAYIALTELGDGSTQYDAHVMNMNGSGDAIVALNAQGLAWSPDGSQIAYRDNPGVDDTLWVMNADGSGKRQISSTTVGICDWSPDGETLACHGIDGGVSGIKLISVATGAVTAIKGNAHSPVWSPDGDEIAFSVRDSGRISVMDANGSNVRDLVEGYGPYDWVGPGLISVEFTQAIQQLQSISELQADLQGDGKPPVPIVAGKPAAMRVLFDKVDAAKTYKVEVSGEFTGDETVTLTPGCTQDQRRKQAGGCKSVDFYFTPPEGSWSVILRVTEAGAVVEEHEFNLTSELSDAIVLKAVDVCHAQSTLLGPWTCQSAASLVALASHLRKVVPTDNVSVVLGGHQVRRRVSDYANAEDWMSDVVGDIDDLYTAFDAGVAGQDVYYFGLSDSLVGGYNGVAAGAPGHGGLSRAFASAWGQTTTHTTIAHEVGHLMGLEHTGVNQPAAAAAPGCWGGGLDPAGWPFPDNKLYAPQNPFRADTVEVGFDVASQTALPGDEYFELISYCVPRWVSAHSYVKFLGPAGPLARANAAPRAAADDAGQFWLVAGAIADGGAEFKPLVEIETEGPASAGSGAYRIEVRDGAGSVLLTRLFTPRERHPEAGPGQEESEAPPVFSELIPVQAGAAAIVVFDDQDAELGRITLGGAAPSVSITQAANDGNAVTVTWTVTDADSAEHTYWVDYSPDGGTTWQNQAMGLSDAALALDADLLAGSGNAVVRIMASDGVNSGEAVSAPFTVAGKLPEGEIIGPQRTSFRQGDLVWLEAAAWDIDDGTLDGGDVTWSSSRDGNLGAGASLPVYGLSVGNHTITMTAKDSDNNAVTDSIVVTVSDSPIIEGEPDVLSGDVDCSGGVNSIDALKLLRHVAGLSVDQSGDCPGIGTGDADIFGDVDCDGSVTAVDALFVLRFVAALPVNVPQGCRPVGT